VRPKRDVEEAPRERGRPRRDDGGEVRSPREVRDLLRCPRCESRNIIYSRRTADHSCRRCGCVFVVDFEKGVIHEEEGE